MNRKLLHLVRVGSFGLFSIICIIAIFAILTDHLGFALRLLRYSTGVLFVLVVAYLLDLKHE